jgi:hypothetical protein
MTALLTALPPLLAVLGSCGLAQQSKPTAAVFGNVTSQTVVRRVTGPITGRISGLPPTSEIRVAYRRPDDVNLTVSSKPCVVADDSFDCPSLRLPTAERPGYFQIVLVQIDQSTRERLRDFALDIGAPATLRLPREAELARVTVRCANPR